MLFCSSGRRFHQISLFPLTVFLRLAHCFKCCVRHYLYQRKGYNYIIAKLLLFVTIFLHILDHGARSHNTVCTLHRLPCFSHIPPSIYISLHKFCNTFHTVLWLHSWLFPFQYFTEVYWFFIFP